MRSASLLVRLEPEVGIEPTTYRLQDARSAPSMPSSCDDGFQVGHIRGATPHRLTTVRATSRATARVLPLAVIRSQSVGAEARAPAATSPPGALAEPRPRREGGRCRIQTSIRNSQRDALPFLPQCALSGGWPVRCRLESSDFDACPGEHSQVKSPHPRGPAGPHIVGRSDVPGRPDIGHAGDRSQVSEGLVGVGQRRAWLVTQVRDQPVTSAEASRALPGLVGDLLAGKALTANRVRGYARHGRLTQHRPHPHDWDVDEAGRPIVPAPRYQIGELIDRLQRIAADEAAYRARESQSHSSRPGTKPTAQTCCEQSGSGYLRTQAGLM
jgi:hypothetical protein